MLIKAVFAFLALPGMVAFAVPAALLSYAGHTRLEHPAGLICVAAGATGLVWCAVDFYLSGKGTLAPWAPPAKLVISGPYRYSRNPMYLAVALILVGWAVSFDSWHILIYAVLVIFAFYLRVVHGEEPWLARQHGVEWQRYARRVPRWF